MNPDGPEERMAAHREYYDNQPDDPDDTDVDQDLESDLLDIAQSRINQLSRVS